MGCFDYFRIFQNSRVFLYIDRENSKSLSEFEFRAKDSQAKTDQTTDNNKRKNEKKIEEVWGSGGVWGKGLGLDIGFIDLCAVHAVSLHCSCGSRGPLSPS